MPDYKHWRGWRGRIALLMPDDSINDDEYYSYLPLGVGLLTTRYVDSVEANGASTDSNGALATAREAIIAATLRRLRQLRPNVVAVSDHQIGFDQEGHWNGDHIKRLSAAAQAPTTTVSTALIAALSALRVQRIALGSPNDSVHTDRCVDYLESHGFECVHQLALGVVTPLEVGLAPPQRWYAFAKAVNDNAAEAVVLLGKIHLAAIWRMLERDLGKPVIPTTGALVWHATQLMCIDAQTPNFGQLFSQHGASGLQDELSLI